MLASLCSHKASTRERHWCWCAANFVIAFQCPCEATAFQVFQWISPLSLCMATFLSAIWCQVWAVMEILLVLLKCRLGEYRHRGMSAQWMSAPWNRLGGSRLMLAPSPVPFIHSVLRPLLWVANLPCKFRLSAAIFIWSYRFEPVKSLRSSTYVRLGLPLPRLPSRLPSIVVSRVS